jgi:uracil-DNA glycosylase family 4
VIFVDGSPILYRAWHVYDLTTGRGEPTNIIYGVLKILEGIARKIGPDVTVFWDAGKSAYRAERYAAYKQQASRKVSREKPGYREGAFNEQIPIVWDFLRALGIRQVGAHGVEADDLIAIASATVANSVVAADDHDLWQLVGQNGATVWAPMKERWLRTRQDCYDEIGLYPDQIADYKALAGDSSDNIPGVDGLGDKTAKTILAVCGGVAELYRRLRAGEQQRAGVSAKMAERLLAEEQQVKLWFDLVQPLSWEMLSPEQQQAFTATWTASVSLDRQELSALMDRWELKSILVRFNEFVEAFHPSEASQREQRIEQLLDVGAHLEPVGQVERQGSPPRVPYAKGSATSKAAAQAIAPHVENLAERVFRYVEQQGPLGATRDEVEVALDMIHQTASARVYDLVKAGRLVETERTRPTRSGTMAGVLVAVSPPLRPTFDPPLPLNDLDRLRAIGERVAACTACTMRAECSAPVPGNLEDPSGRPFAMIVGRNPGANEDRQGRGFVGAAGRRLDQWLAGQNRDGQQVADPIPLRRAETFVTNVAHCFTTGNRPPTPQEWQTCAGLHLREEIRVLQPRVILSFGAEAMEALTGHGDSIMNRSGTSLLGREANGIVQYAQQDGERRWDPVIPPDCTIFIVPHPAAALRMASMDQKFQQAGRVVAAWLKEEK